MATTTPVSPSVSVLSFSPPILPARSPLRPPARSISSQSSTTVSTTILPPSNTSTLTLDSPVSPQTPTDDLPNISDLSLPAQFQMRDRHNSFPSLNGFIDPLLEHENSFSDALRKSLPERPQTPLSINLEDDLADSATSASNSNSSSSASSVAHSVSHPPTMSKRHHAMHELLSSERAYASDLVLIKAAHIPLALGEVPPLQNATSSSSSNSNSNNNSNSNSNSSSSPSLPSGSNGSGSGSSGPSSRTVSTASDSSSESNNLIAPLAQCMTTEDVKIIFGNIDELAVLSNAFTEKLEQALGPVVDGGQGEDYIGALFLQTIPQLERPYKQYITRHPGALQHLQNLPQTPELTEYLAYTQRVAHEYSHAWDLASLLIKPVQRLLKYPLLLNAIIDETPDNHPDKENLRNARERIEELARNVNEGRRRAEVVKDVLTSKTPKKPNAPVGVSASVNLSKVKSLRHGGVTAATMRVSQLTEGNGEAAQVEAMQAELKKIEVFAQQFARNVVDWGKMMANVMLALRTWAFSFGKVIGLSADQGSEAFDAFMNVIRAKLMPLTADLEAAINERLLKDMAHLLMTMNQPLKLLASMNEQEPYHYHLLTMPVSQKNRPPPALLAASTNYLALRGQLAAELPTYINLLHKGFVTFVLRLSNIQTRFWKDVKEHWAELWEMLRVESELNVGWEETCHVWKARWGDVDEVVKALAIMQPVPHIQPTPRMWYTTPVPVPSSPPAANLPPPAAASTQFEEYFGYPGYYMPMTPNFSSPPPTKERRESNGKLEKHNSKSSSGHGHNSNNNNNNGNGNGKVATVHSMFAALEPTHSPVHKHPSKQSVNTNVPRNNNNNNNNTAAMASSASLAAYSPVFVAGSLFGVGSSSMYAVSGPMPLGSVPVPHRGRRSDASTLASGNGSGSSGSGSRRPSSQDSVQPRQQLRDGSTNGYGQRGHGHGHEHLARRRTHGHGMAEEYAEYVAIHGGVPPPYEGGQYPYSSSSGPGVVANGNGQHQHQQHQHQHRQGLTRMKSMPLSHNNNDNNNTGNGFSDRVSLSTAATSKTAVGSTGGALSLTNGGGYVVDGDRVYYQPPLEPVSVEEFWDDGQQHRYIMEQHQSLFEYQYLDTPRQGQGQGDERGRDTTRAGGGGGGGGSRSSGQSQGQVSSTAAAPSSKSGGTSPKRASKTKEHARKRSGSVKSITSFFTGSSNGNGNGNSNSNSHSPPPDPQPLTASQRDSWVSKPAKYVCQVIHPCKPPASVSYYSFPFFTLKEGDLFEVLQEAGHPSIHPKLPLYVDDGEDCLLLCRDGNGVVGWALASFLEPLSLSG